MNYDAVLLEIIMVIAGVLTLVMGLVLPRERKNLVGYISTSFLIVILLVSFVYSPKEGISFYYGIYKIDSMSTYFKQIFIISAALISLISVTYVKRLSDSKSEFFALIIFAALGMMVMASANDLITLFVGLELMSLSFIILTAYDKKSLKSAEAGTKYILLSATSTAVLLYGMSYLYGLSGSTSFTGIYDALKGGSNQPIIILACIFVIAGFGFKVSAVPFHMWSPDVYEGAPAPVTAFLAAGSKIAAFAVLIKITMQVIEPSFNTISVIIVILSVLSMIIGNLMALPQTNIKRMLAYSGIAHAGYILTGIVSHTVTGTSAMMYYLLLYIFANIGAFAAITAFSNETGKEEIQDFTGMWKKSPFLAATLMISLLSLAGIPPAAGFIGKLYLFSEAVKQEYLWLALLAMVMSTVSIFYYIKVIKVMLMGEAIENEKIKIAPTVKVVMVICIIMILVMGLFPGPITSWTTNAAGAFLN